jgi:protein TonB
MFKVLSGEKKRRVISPATITASVAAHLLLLGGLAYASTGDKGPVEMVGPEMMLPDLVPEPKAPPPPPVETQPTPPAPDDEPAKAPTPVTVLEVPDVKVTEGIRPEAPDVVPVDPRQYEGDGRTGPEITGPTTGPTEPGEGEGPAPVEEYIPGEDMVEVRPVLDRNGLSRALERNYPAVLRDSRVSGRVVIEVIVEANGRPRPGSARVVDASHPAFGEAALRAVDRFRFRPARIGGTPVPVRVTIPIVWTAN